MGTQIEQFEILLEHDIDEQYQYQPGEMLCGTVVLQVSDPIKITAIQVQIRGESTVSWEEEGRNPVQYKAEEVYIDVTQNIVTADAGALLTLDNGVHKYPMEYILPSNLPSSFIGKHGSITYVVKATLKEDKRFGLSTMITSEPFLVLRKLDISKEHALLMSREETITKRFSGGVAFCMGGKVQATFKVNKTGHLPGEDIFMDAEISNQSPRVVEAMEASIIMHSTFHAKNKTRFNKQIVNKKRDEWELIEGEGRRWKGVRLTIPPYIPESRLDGCDIIDIKYELNFLVDISGKNNFLSCSIPITVGSASSAHSRPQCENRTNTVSNWRSKDELYNDATLPIRATDSGVGSDSGVAENASEIRTEDEVDLDMISEKTLTFRRPIGMGETRHNPLMEYMENGGDEHEMHELTNHMSENNRIASDTEDGNEYNNINDYNRQGSGTYQDDLHIEPDMDENESYSGDDAPAHDAPPLPQQGSTKRQAPAPPPPSGPAETIPTPPSSPPAPPPLRPGP